MWDAGRRAPPPKVLARARALATHRDDHELLPLPVLALLVGVHVKTLRPRRQRASGRPPDAGGVRFRRVVNEGDLLRVGMEVGGHVRAGRFEPLAKSVARLVRDVDVALAGASCLLLPGTRMLTLGLGRFQGSQVTRSGPISWHREGDVSGTLRDIVPLHEQTLASASVLSRVLPGSRQQLAHPPAQATAGFPRVARGPACGRLRSGPRLPESREP